MKLSRDLGFNRNDKPERNAGNQRVRMQQDGLRRDKLLKTTIERWAT